MADEKFTEDELFLDVYDDDQEPVPVQDAAPQDQQDADTEATDTPQADEAQEDEAAATQAADDDPGTQSSDDEANVPSWRLREVTEARIAAEQAKALSDTELVQMRADMAAMRHQIASQQPPPVIPDMFEDPEGFKQHQDNQLQQTITANNIRFSKLEAAQAYGVEGSKIRDEAWAAAVAAETTTPGLTQRIGNAQNPWMEAIAWYNQTKMQEVIGDDVDAYEQKLINDPAHQQKVLDMVKGNTTGGQVVGKVPPTIPSLNGAAAANRQTDKGAVTEDELFNL